MKVEYKREMNRNYMVICPETGRTDRYTLQMISENKIPGLLEMQEKSLDGMTRYYYDITSKQPLKRILEHRTLPANEIRLLISDLLGVLRQLERFLLDESQLSIDPEYIYMDPDCFRGFFCLIPETRTDFSNLLFEFSQYILDHVDHSDGEAVVLAFSIFCACKKENFGIHDIEACLGATSDIESKEEKRDREDNKDKEKNDFEVGEEYGFIRKNSELENEEAFENHIYKKSNNKIGILGLIVIMMLIPVFIIIFCGIRNFLIWKWIVVAVELILTVIGVIFWKVGAFTDTKSFKKATPETRTSSKNVKPETKMMFRNDLDYDEDDELELWGEMFLEEDPKNQKRDEVPKSKSASMIEDDLQEDETMQTILLTSVDKTEKYGKRYLATSDGKIKIEISYFPYLIGKSKSMSDFCINEPGISRLHVKIEKENEGYFVTDLNSTNGTWVNGQLMEANERKQLFFGDELMLANIKFLFN